MHSLANLAERENGIDGDFYLAAFVHGYQCIYVFDQFGPT
jgi:hypothetical protein